MEKTLDGYLEEVHKRYPELSEKERLDLAFATWAASENIDNHYRGADNTLFDQAARRDNAMDAIVLMCLVGVLASGFLATLVGQVLSVHH